MEGSLAKLKTGNDEKNAEFVLVSTFLRYRVMILIDYRYSLS
jgi:hypothetical protein